MVLENTRVSPQNAGLKLARAHVPLNDSYLPLRALELERGICDADRRFD